MEIAASPQAPALHLQWGLDGEALGTGADAAAPPPSSSCLCRGAALLLQPALSRPLIQKLNHISKLMALHL